MTRQGGSRELTVAIAIAVVVALSFVAVALSTVAAREDLDALERSIEAAVEESAKGADIPRPECDQQEAVIYRCLIAASVDDPASARATYRVRLEETGCWRFRAGERGLSALGIGTLVGCVHDYRD